MKNFLFFSLLLLFSCKNKNNKTSTPTSTPTPTSTVHSLNITSTFGGYSLKINGTTQQMLGGSTVTGTWQVNTGDNISFTHNCNPTTQFGPNGQNLGSFCQQISVSIKIDNSVVYNQNCYCTATYSTVIQ